MSPFNESWPFPGGSTQLAQGNQQVASSVDIDPYAAI